MNDPPHDYSGGHHDEVLEYVSSPTCVWTFFFFLGIKFLVRQEESDYIRNIIIIDN